MYKRTWFYGLIAVVAVVGYRGWVAVKAEAPQTARRTFGEAGKAVTEANQRFAFDLYREIAAESDDNLFFSPYSIAEAMAMVTEGARGETANELGRTLGWNDDLRLQDSSGDAPFRPWDSKRINLGFAEVDDRFNYEDTAATKKLKQKISGLRAKLTAINGLANVGLASFAKQQEAEQIAAKINKLTKNLNRVELNVANALWAANDFQIRSEFTSEMERFYGTEGIQSCDFANDPNGAAQRINSWVSKQTRGKIPTIVDARQLDALTRLVLTNAIYFKAPWAKPFNARRTKDLEFTLANGESLTRPMMNQWDDYVYGAFNGDGTPFNTPDRVPQDNHRTNQVQTYPDDDGFSLIEVPYHGDEMTMVVIAPRNHAKLPQLEQQLTAENFSAWLASAKQRRSKLYLPRFKMETKYTLTDGVLQKLGIKRAFRRGEAEFAGINEDEDLYISSVVHKAFVEVNEEGTEAAAATAIAVDATAAPPVEMVPFYPEFRADRPFIVVLRDRTTGTVLFVGRVTRV